MNKILGRVEGLTFSENTNVNIKLRHGNQMFFGPWWFYIVISNQMTVQLQGNGVIVIENPSGYHEKITPLFQYQNLSHGHYHPLPNKTKAKLETPSPLMMSVLVSSIHTKS